MLAQVRTLVFSAFSGRFDEHDWDHTLGGTHLVLAEGGTVVAHAAIVERWLDVGDRTFHVGYLEGVATAPKRHGTGLGSAVVAAANDVVRAGFEMGSLSTSRWTFYERLGWERWRGPSYVRRGDHPVRTPDDDDGIMVLRFAASADVRLDERIVCRLRAGDVW